jgi:tRNA threonylcarbamoyladenosine biosynthesis protein TsaE
VAVFETDGPEATEALGAQLAARLVAGDVIHLVGELGTGKTTLVRGACRALGVSVPVTSPTFAIAHRYHAAAGTAVSHIDLYRLGSLDSEDPDLLADYVGEDAITFVEWPPDQTSAAGAPPRITVSFSHVGGDRRRVEVSGG